MIFCAKNIEVFARYSSSYPEENTTITKSLVRHWIQKKLSAYRVVYSDKRYKESDEVRKCFAYSAFSKLR